MMSIITFDEHNKMTDLFDRFHSFLWHIFFLTANNVCNPNESRPYVSVAIGFKLSSYTHDLHN